MSRQNNVNNFYNVTVNDYNQHYPLHNEDNHNYSNDNDEFVVEWASASLVRIQSSCFVRFIIAATRH